LTLMLLLTLMVLKRARLRSSVGLKIFLDQLSQYGYTSDIH